MNQAEYDGKTINVSVAKPREDRPEGSLSAAVVAVAVSVAAVAAVLVATVVATVVVVLPVIAEIAVTIINTNSGIYLYFEEISKKYPEVDSGR